MGVDGVSAARRYQPIAPPSSRHSRTSPKFLPRRPLHRQPRFDGAKCRLRYRSTANPTALNRLLWWFRHSSLLLGPLPVLLCMQPILPHGVGDAGTYRLRWLQGGEVGNIARRLRRARGVWVCRPQSFTASLTHTRTTEQKTDVKKEETEETERTERWESAAPVSRGKG